MYDVRCTLYLYVYSATIDYVLNVHRYMYVCSLHTERYLPSSLVRDQGAPQHTCTGTFVAPEAAAAAAAATAATTLAAATTPFRDPQNHDKHITGRAQ